MSMAGLGMIAGLLLALAALVGGVGGLLLALLLGAAGYALGGHRDGQFDLGELLRSGRG